MRIATPAKINLTLEILGQRPDGFHELATWMIPIGLYDQVSLEVSSEMTYETNLSNLAFDHTNLILRAIERFQEATGRSAAYRVGLSKVILICAGLVCVVRVVSADLVLFT